jgi:hypothetical protein
MTAFSRTKFVLPMVSLLTAVSLSAQAQEPQHHQGVPPAAPRGAPAARPGPAPGGGHPVGPIAGHPGGPAGFHAAGPGRPGPVGRGPDARFMHGAIVAHNFGGHPYRGRLGWEGGRWRHEVHDGRDGWWWDVGGVWYYYPQPMEGPPTYVSEDFSDDVVYAPEAAYDPGPPPPVAYEPAPPPPPDPGASAVGGAIVGGVLGGLLTGRASGAAAGAVIGGATGAIAGATAASRPGYYLAQGNCYYRYPSGQYVAVDPRSCY